MRSTIKTILIVFGLATSVPLIIAGSALLMALLNRFPILVWAGAGLLGWVAGEIMIKDAAVASWLGQATVDTLAPVGRRRRRGVRDRARLDRSAASQHKRALEQPLIIDPPGPEEFPQSRRTERAVEVRAVVDAALHPAGIGLTSTSDGSVLD